MIYILSFILKNIFQAMTFKVKENARTFQGLALKFKDSSRKNGFQGCLKDSPKNSRTFQDCVNRNLVAFSLFSAVNFFSDYFQSKMLSKTSTCPHLIAKRQQVFDSSVVMIIGSQCLISK